MLKYIFKRLFLLILALIVITIIVFFLLQLMPGLPKAVEARLDEAKTPDERASILASFDLDGNAFEKFGKYISGFFKGNYGMYYTAPTVGIDKIFTRPLKYTFMITGPAFILGTLLGLIFGFISGYKRGRWPDITVNVIAIFFVSIPSFVLATFLLLFGRQIGLPIDFITAQNIGKAALAVVLPILIITITSFSTLTYFIRNEVVEVLTSDYISIARAKGMSERRIFFKHLLRNVSIPLVAIVLPSFVGILFGSLIIEVFFNVPGSSSIFTSAIEMRETYVVMFSAIFFSGISLLLELIVDVSYVILDPRIKIANAGNNTLIKVIKGKIARIKEAQALKREGESISND